MTISLFLSLYFVVIQHQTLTFQYTFCWPRSLFSGFNNVIFIAFLGYQENNSMLNILYAVLYQTVIEEVCRYIVLTLSPSCPCGPGAPGAPLYP